MDFSHVTSKKDLPKEMGELQQFTWSLLLHYQQLRERYSLLTKRHFGQSSERSDELDAIQQEMDALLSQLEETLESPTEEESFESVPIPAHVRRRKHPGRNVIPETVETESVLHDISDEEKRCECCGHDKVEIDRKEHVVITRIPAKYKKIVHIRPVYGCSKCKNSISIAEPVVLPIPKGIVDVSVLCFVIDSKYRYHLPLYRIQRQIFHESGIWFTRSTMVSWLRYLYKSVRRIHYELLGEYKRSLLKHADESPIKVRLPDVAGRHPDGRMWVGLGKNEHNGPVTAVFHYDKRRSKEAALRFLKGAEAGDILMIDGCESYSASVKKYDLVVLNCMAHARRKFKEALDTGYKTDYCRSVLRKFTQLYRIERFADQKQATPALRQQLREKHSKRIMADIKNLLMEPGFAVLPSRKVGNAINYMLNHWDNLMRFTENGFYPIDNNPVERIIRTLAIGRKNWMCAGSENGARWCAVYYSIYATCLLNGIDAEEYLKDVLMRLAIRPSNADVKDLLPVAWAKQNANFKNVKIEYPKN